jgi:hypothetical protein
MSNQFRFGAGEDAHTIGDDNCKACRWELPVVCLECGDGLQHIELSPKKTGPVFVYRCDVCAGLGPQWQKGVDGAAGNR